MKITGPDALGGRRRSVLSSNGLNTMQSDQLHRWQHSHTLGQDLKRPGETRTLVVIAITAAMMIVEIVAGVLFGSMALLADGLRPWLIGTLG
jgi:hypothetical protein